MQTSNKEDLKHIRGNIDYIQRHDRLMIDGLMIEFSIITREAKRE